jgi:hypothetical protein
MQGALTAMKLFSGFVTTILLVICGWAYNRIEMNRDLNMSQENRMQTIDRNISDLMREKK